MMGSQPDPKRLEECQGMIDKSIKMLEEHFLVDTKYISSNEISIADLQAMCEFTQYWMADLDLLEDHPRLQQWMKDCQDTLTPHFDKVHKMVYLAREKGIVKSKT